MTLEDYQMGLPSTGSGKRSAAFANDTLQLGSPGCGKSSFLRNFVDDLIANDKIWIAIKSDEPDTFSGHHEEPFWADIFEKTLQYAITQVHQTNRKE